MGGLGGRLVTRDFIQIGNTDASVIEPSKNSVAKNIHSFAHMGDVRFRQVAPGSTAGLILKTKLI